MIASVLREIVGVPQRILDDAIAAVGGVTDMVHLIVMKQGSEQEVEAAEAVVKGARSWKRIEPGVWLVATKARARDYRDKLKVELPSAHFLVAELSGTWAGHDMGRTTEWLKAHGDDF